MSVPLELARLLDQDDALVSSFDALGSRVPWPETLPIGSATALPGDTPLDALSSATRSRAVAAYEAARRRGHGAAIVELAADGRRQRLEVFDLEMNHGCFVAVATDPETTSEPEAGTAGLAPRRSTYQLDVVGTIEAISPEFTAMFGWAPDEVVGLSSLDLIHPDDHEAGIVAWCEMLEAAGAVTRVRQRFKTASGDWLWCEITDSNRLDDPDAPTVDGELLDVSRELAAQAALQRRETLFDRLNRALPSGVLHLEVDGEVSVCNDRWTELTGLGRLDGLEPLIERLETSEAVRSAVAAAIVAGTDADLEVSVSDPLGCCRHGNLHLRPLRENDEHVGLLVTLDDTTTVRDQQQALAEQGRRDPLTGALNRLGLQQALEALLITTGDGSTGPTVLFIDLDRFKAVNDEHGHSSGDDVLVTVTAAISSLLRPTDLLGRIGGDEFIVVLDGDLAPAEVTKAVERIDRGIPDAVSAGGFSVGASIGTATARTGDDFDTLISRADAAMYTVKRAGQADRSPSSDSRQPIE